MGVIFFLESAEFYIQWQKFSLVALKPTKLLLSRYMIEVLYARRGMISKNFQAFSLNCSSGEMGLSPAY